MKALPTGLLPALLALVLGACTLTPHEVAESRIGSLTSLAEVEKTLDTPGPVTVDTIGSADWAVSLKGLLNLDSPAARAANLLDRPEQIKIFCHLVRHPKFGAFLVDTGVSQQLLDDPRGHGVPWIALQFLPLDEIHLRLATAQILAGIQGGLRGVFFTHLHIDHIAGLPDIPVDVPLYVGPGETSHHSFANIMMRGVTTRLLAGRPPLQEWPFRPASDNSGNAIGDVVDIFGDGSAYAISVPGHTRGSTAYLFRTPKGPVLLTGDTSHTRWGWSHDVEPGTFTEDQGMNLRSLRLLEGLANRNPRIEVRLGHQY